MDLGQVVLPISESVSQTESKVLGVTYTTR